MAAREADSSGGAVGALCGSTFHCANRAYSIDSVALIWSSNTCLT
jgi:hypothetical protein